MGLKDKILCFKEELSDLARCDFPLRHSKPSTSVEDSLILKLKTLEEQSLLTFNLLEVKKDFLPEFLRDLYFVDCVLKVDRKLTFLPSVKDTFGSGVDSNFLSASCHALGEGLERHLGFLGGTKDSRPSLNSAFSLIHKEWIELNFNPFSSDSRLNPFSVPCGQACHMVLDEAFRNALGELIEKNFIATVDEDHDWFDITDDLVLEDPHAKISKIYWESLGYDFKIHVAISKLGGFVAIASAEKLDDGLGHKIQSNLSVEKFGTTFRGSAADFGLEYAPMQAISELNRSAFFGPYLNIKSAEDCLVERSKLSPDNYYFGYLERLRTGDWLVQLAKNASSKATLSGLKNARGFSLSRVIQNIRTEYKDFFVIPFSTLESIGVNGIKIAVPGLNVSSLSRLSL